MPPTLKGRGYIGGNKVGATLVGGMPTLKGRLSVAGTKEINYEITKANREETEG